MNFEEFKSKFEKEPVETINNETLLKPLVSVCIQTFNQVNYIGKCLEGILLQKTSFPIEILLADDESDDGTREICLEYAKEYPEKIRLFLHSRKNNIKVGGHPSANFIALYNLFSTKGKYIAVCEGDDFWGDPQKLQKQYEFMEANPDYAICYHDYKIINFSGKVIESTKAAPVKRDLQDHELLVPFIHPATLTAFFKNVINPNLPIEMTKVLALDVFLSSLLGQLGPGKYLDHIQPAFYRVHKGGVWSGMEIEPKLISKINSFEKISSYYSKKGKRETAILFDKRIKKIKKYLIFLSLKKLKLISAYKFMRDL